MKRLKLIQNLAMISPVGNQFAEKETSNPSDLQHTWEGVDTSLKITDSDPTVAYTQANLIYSDGHAVTAGATTNIQEQKNSIQGMMQPSGIKPYGLSLGQYYLAPLGLNQTQVYSGSGTPVYDGDTEYSSDRLLMVGADVRSHTGTRLAFNQNVSTLFSSVYAMLNNADVKVVLAYNRSLDWNTYTENSQIASMWAYHADVFSLLAVFNLISGLVSWNYKANEIAKIQVEADTVYSPELYASMLTAAREVANLPILDKQTAEFIQITTKYYAAQKDVYYPGSFMYFDCVLPTGFAGGATSGATGSYKNITFDNGATNFCASSGLTTYRAIRTALRTAATSATLVDWFNTIKTCAQAISRVYRPVIQVLVQMNSKGIYTPETVDKYMDFVIGDEDNGGIIIYDIVKDYYVSNLFKFHPQVIVQNDQSPKYSIIGPNVISTNFTGAVTVFDGIPQRLFGPFEMSQDIYDTKELLGCMVLQNPAASNLTNSAAHFLMTDKVTGTGVYVGDIIVTFNNDLGGYLVAPGCRTVTTTTRSSLVNVGEEDYNLALNTFLGNGNLQRMLKGMVCDAVLSQFDLKYLVERVLPVTTVEDNDALHTAFFNDEYFMPIPLSNLETANASYYTHIMDKVTWMDGSSKGKDKYKADTEKSAGEYKDK